MGHHFIPQAYLRSFADPNYPKSIWVYDKHGSVPRLASIQKVAQSKQYFDPEVECTLASEVEGPANPIMDKLRRQIPIGPIERAGIAAYIAVMMMRVPHHRKKKEDLFPGVLDETVEETRAELLRLKDDPAFDQALLRRRLAELDAVEQRYRVEPPQSFIDDVRKPWPTRKVTETIFDMNWRILRSDAPSFVTCDNPAHFFECYGLGRMESELTFPLSSTCVLLGSWQGFRRGLTMGEASQPVVDEVNRRLVTSSTRLCFFQKQETWVQRLLAEKDPKLNRINWVD